MLTTTMYEEKTNIPKEVNITNALMTLIEMDSRIEELVGIIECRIVGTTPSVPENDSRGQNQRTGYVSLLDAMLMDRERLMKKLDALIRIM